MSGFISINYSNYIIQHFCLGSVGADFQKQNAETIVKILNGKPIDEVISAGLSKLASVPSGAAPTAAAPAAGGGKPAGKSIL